MRRTKRLPRHNRQQSSPCAASTTGPYGDVPSCSSSWYGSESDCDDTTPRIGFVDPDATPHVGSTSHMRTELDLWDRTVSKRTLSLLHIPDTFVDDGWNDEDPFAFHPPPPSTQHVVSKNASITSNECLSAKRKDCFRREKRLLRPTLSLAWPKIEPEDELVSLEEASKILAVVPGVFSASPDAVFCDDGYEETLRRRSLSNASEHD